MQFFNDSGVKKLLIFLNIISSILLKQGFFKSDLADKIFHNFEFCRVKLAGLAVLAEAGSHNFNDILPELPVVAD